MLVRWYLAYSLSYRDIEELALERGLNVDHSSVIRFIVIRPINMPLHVLVTFYLMQRPFLPCCFGVI